MSKEAILERIISDAKTAAAATVAEAEGRAAEIIAEAEARAERDRQGTSTIIAERSKAIADGKAATARLDAAKVMLAAKRGVIDEVYARALEKLKALVFATNFAYKAQVLKLAVVAEKNLKNSGKTADIDGGFILIGKNSDKDLSYGALLALDREERQAEIAAKLFSDGVSNA